MRKFLIFFCVWLGLVAGVAAETLTLTDGTSVTGDIVKSDDVGVMIHTSTDSYPNLQWSQFSQDSLKQLATNPKYKGYVELLIEPTAVDRAAKAQLAVRPVNRLASPSELQPSLLGGLLHSSLGLFLLLVIYAANLYAGYEVAVVRGKPMAMVIAVSVVLPIIGPIIFLTQPVGSKQEEEVVDYSMPDDTPTGATPAGGKPSVPNGPQEEIEVVAASWQAKQEEEKKAQAKPQVFARGRFTFNKRFIETKFAGFIGELKGDGKKFTMEIKTSQATIVVECIKQMGANEAILETPNGQVTVAFGDIQEVVLTPKPA